MQDLVDTKVGDIAAGADSILTSLANHTDSKRQTIGIDLIVTMPEKARGNIEKLDLGRVTELVKA